MKTMYGRRSRPRKMNIRLYQPKRRPSRSWPQLGLADTRLLAGRVVNRAWPNVWLLQGPLGSGKTAFARSVLRALGFTGRVNSPTFVLRHDYFLEHPRWKRVVHVDAYRVRSRLEEAALDLGAIADDPACLVIIEWPEKLRRLPAGSALKIHFFHQRRGRRITFSVAV